MKRCVVDTNVMVTANKAVKNHDDFNNYPNLIIDCIKTLHNITVDGIYVVLDTDNEIFIEYKNYLSFSGQPGVGDSFFKWVHDNRYKYPDTEVKLHKTNEGYNEYPNEMESLGVDPNDMKFFAVSNKHPLKPPIYQAVDTKWWGWAMEANKCGIKIIFIDEQYMIDHN